MSSIQVTRALELFRGLHMANPGFRASRGVLQSTHATHPTRYMKMKSKWIKNFSWEFFRAWRFISKQRKTIAQMLPESTRKIDWPMKYFWKCGKRSWS